MYHWNHKQIGVATRIGGTAKKQWLLDAEQPATMTPDQLRVIPLPPRHEPSASASADGKPAAAKAKAPAKPAAGKAAPAKKAAPAPKKKAA